MDNKTIFWDMDGTLGFFEHFVDYENLDEVPDDIKTFGLKKNIEGLLKELNELGFKQHVTTSGIRKYADISLNATGIRKYFQNVYAREDLCENSGGWTFGPKNYQVPIKDLKINIRKAGADVLIIGNSKNDVPYNMSEIVTILDEDSWMRDSELTRKMIKILLERGEGNFNRGFYKLYAESEKIGRIYKNLSDRGRMHLEKSIILGLEFMEERNKAAVQAPMFIVEKADKYYILQK